jgi:hypothetical protein
MWKPLDLVDQQIADAVKRQERCRADVEILKRRSKLLQRKYEARQKIVLGVGVWKLTQMYSEFRDQLIKLLPLVITRPVDRAVLPEFFPDDPARTEPPARPPKKPGAPPSGAAPA